MVPKLFSEFYDSVVEEARKRRAQRLSDEVKRTMASEERIAELSENVYRAAATKKFLDGDFWIDYLQPYLRSEAVLKPAVLKDGDAALADRVMHEFLIGSGQVRMMAKLITKLDEWQVSGAEAEKILQLEIEKKKQLRDFGG